MKLISKRDHPHTRLEQNLGLQITSLSAADAYPSLADTHDVIRLFPRSLQKICYTVK